MSFTRSEIVEAIYAAVSKTSCPGHLEDLKEKYIKQFKEEKDKKTTKKKAADKEVENEKKSKWTKGDKPISDTNPFYKALLDQCPAKRCIGNKLNWSVDIPTTALIPASTASSRGGGDLGRNFGKGRGCNCSLPIGEEERRKREEFKDLVHECAMDTLRKAHKNRRKRYLNKRRQLNNVRHRRKRYSKKQRLVRS